jgi:hypothetical protein
LPLMLVFGAWRALARFTPAFQRGDIALKVSPGALGAPILRYSMPGPGIQVCLIDIEPSPAAITRNTYWTSSP